MKSVSRFLTPLLVATALLTGFSPAAVAQTWPHEKSDLTPDPKATWGKLDNGLRYVIYPNKFPIAGRASVRLYVDAGSLMEEEDQRGMAHFLEHMAFNGSNRFAAGTMVEYFQRLGMSFGADTNAHTSFKETVYKLELPKVDEAMLTEAFHLFRDDLDGMLLGEAEIDKERGVILSEKLARDSVESRTMEEGWKFAMPESLLPVRMPIGTEETIKTMKRTRFVDFYEKWYTPKRAVIVVVGDVDPALVEKLVKDNFADAKPRRGDSADPDLGNISKGRGLIAKLHTEMESPAVEISLETVREAKKDPDTAARRRSKIIRNLADSMLNQRFQKLAKEENSPIMEAESYNFDLFRFVESSGITAKSKPEMWKPALALIEQELRRAVQYGFSKAEFTEATADLLKKTRLRAEQKETRKNNELADALVRSMGSQQVFTDPTDDAARVQADLANVTVEDCVMAMRESWSTKDLMVFIGGNLELKEASTTIATALVESASVPVTAPASENDAAFAYTTFGEAGKLVKKEEIKDLEITQGTFANNVRVNIKKTEFEKNSIRVLATFGGGKLEAPADKPGLLQYAAAVFEPGGLEKHSADELRRLFAGEDVSVSFAVADDSFTLTGKTTPQDLESQLKILTAYLVAPGYREDADRQFRKSLDAAYTELERTAEGVMQNQVVGFVHSDDFRFHFPTRAVMEQRNLAELKEWLTPALKEGYLEISIIGDVDVDKTLELLSQTFGAIPDRAKEKPRFEEARVVKFPAAPREKTFNFSTEIPRSYALAYWPTEDMLNIQRTRRLTLLGQILDDRLRLKIREELGETYSPASYHVPSDTFTDYGYMVAMATLKPEQVAEVRGMFLEIAAEIGNDASISDDEFQRAKEPQMQQLTQMRRDNRYWLTRVLVNCQAQPYRLDWARSLVDDFGSIKKEDLQTLAKQYLNRDKAITISLIPQVTTPAVTTPDAQAPQKTQPSASSSAKP